MHFGLDIAQQRVPWTELASRARFADELGLDGVWGFDHFQPMYGEGPGECFEGYTTLAALATATTRVRLGLLVTGLTYRPLALLATEAITIDHASNGRLELAIGAAWFEEEHRQMGIPFPPTGARVDLLDDALQIFGRVFTDDNVTYTGKQVQVERLTINPKPVQQPSIPIWVGASGAKRSLPLVAKYADAWHCFGDVAYVSQKSQRLDELCGREGRDPATLLRAASLSLDSIDEARRAIDAWRDAGIGYLIAGWPGAGRPQIEDFARAVL